MKNSRRPYLKICGMHHNITDVAALNPDFLGFIFWEPSERNFQGDIPLLNQKKVGVFVDAPLEDVVHKAGTYDLQLVQLHGSESPEFCAKLQTALKPTASGAASESNGNGKITPNTPPPGVQIIKVFSVGADFDFEQLQTYEACCDFFMFDTKGLLPGGNGFAFNWELLQDYPSEKPFFLSGGIGPEDAGKLKEFLNSDTSRHCFAIDVNSRFERAPGLKDTKKLQRFIKEFNSN